MTTVTLHLFWIRLLLSTLQATKMKSSFDYLEDLLADNYPIIACESPLQERHRLLTRITTYCHCQQAGKKAYIWNLSEDSIKELVVSAEENLVLREFDDYKPSIKISFGAESVEREKVAD
ncbi:MAG: hypothetical protein V7K59_24225 [Nostoc sp.]